jgi:hypothetical protein
MAGVVWTDLMLPPLNLYNFPKQNSKKHAYSCKVVKKQPQDRHEMLVKLLSKRRLG